MAHHDFAAAELAQQFGLPTGSHLTRTHASQLGFQNISITTPVGGPGRGEHA